MTSLEMCCDCGQVPRDGRPQYGRKCRDCYNARLRVSRKAYASERAEYQKQYRESNRTAHRESVRQWRKDNPDKLRATRVRNEHTRRTRKRNAEGSYTEAEWQSIVDFQQGKCAFCKVSCKLTVDHIIPLSKGGSNWPSNLQGLCGKCNSSKGNRICSNI